jgi:pyruvate kinase
MINSKSQIVGTLGEESGKIEILQNMLKSGLDVVRLNMSWGTLDGHGLYIQHVRECEKVFSRKIPIIMDLPGPRIQKSEGHTYKKDIIHALTDHDKDLIKFGIEKNVDYFAISFVGNKEDILEVKSFIAQNSGNQKVIAKIERKVALENFEEILAVTDVVMVARGDLGDELEIEKIPFAEKMMIEKCNEKNIPVIVATQMLLSMVEKPYPTRAEVTDIAYAIVLGSDAVMLSDETAKGKYPVESVQAMEKITKEAEKHLNKNKILHTL